MMRGSIQWYKDMASKLRKVQFDLREFTPEGRALNRFLEDKDQTLWYGTTQALHGPGILAQVEAATVVEHTSETSFTMKDLEDLIDAIDRPPRIEDMFGE